MTDSLLAAYEAAPYHSRPITQSFPPTLEAVALALGVEPPPSDRMRVLELGCAAGGNIIPLADQYPDAQFVGVDLAPGQVAVGHAAIEAIGLTNISLRAQNITDIGDDLGTFDYIICHGVYSWVPVDVQDAILRVCSRHLAPNGLAYLSYNTYPGWRLREMVRDMLVHHDDPSLPPAARVARARRLLNELVAAQTKPTVHAAALAQEAETLRQQEDWHLLHEQLEPFNAPVYFSEFARRAAGHKLAYLAEAKLSSSASRKPKSATGAGGDDLIRAQQYIDFVRGRSFRRSLLCREELARRSWPTADAMARLHYAINATPVEPDAEDVQKAAGREVVALATFEGARMTTNNPILIALMRVLAEQAPRTVSFDELVERVAQSEAESGREDRQSAQQLREGLPGPLFQLALGEFVEAYGRSVSLARHASETPTTSRVARYMAGIGSAVTNPRHYAMDLSDTERFVARHLDGSHTRDQLVRLVGQAISQRVLRTDVAAPMPDPASVVDDALSALAQRGLLIA